MSASCLPPVVPSDSSTQIATPPWTAWAFIRTNICSTETPLSQAPILHYFNLFITMIVVTKETWRRDIEETWAGRQGSGRFPDSSWPEFSCWESAITSTDAWKQWWCGGLQRLDVLSDEYFEVLKLVERKAELACQLVVLTPVAAAAVVWVTGCQGWQCCVRSVEQLAGALNSGRLPGSGPLKRAVRKKLAGKGWPGRSSRSRGQGSAVFEGGRVRLEATTAGRGAMMAASPSAAGGFTATGLSVRKSEEIADLIDLFSKMQYRAKEVTPRVRWDSQCVSSTSQSVTLLCDEQVQLPCGIKEIRVPLYSSKSAHSVGSDM